MDGIEAWRRRRPGWFRRTLARHPRFALALRAALAAAVAWYMAQRLPGPAGDFPYYAPMGAVIATTTTLAGSAREALQSVASIFLGGVIATGVDFIGGDDSHPLVIAVAVAGAVMVAGWSKLGGMGAWVPTAALFTLIIGGGEAYYVGAYAGLVLFGALIGLAFTVLLPQLPLAPAQEAQNDMREVLTTKLENLAGLLEREGALDIEEWRRLYRDPGPYLTAMRSAMVEVEQGARGNRRARSYKRAIAVLRQQDEALERAAYLVEETSRLAMEYENPDVEHFGLGPELRPATARALRHLAEVLDSVQGATADSEALEDAEGSTADPEALERAHQSLDELTRLSDTVRRDVPGGGMLAANSIIMAVQRCLDLVHPKKVTGYEA